MAYTTTCIAGNVQRLHGMTVMFAGNVPSNSPVTNALSLETAGLHTGGGSLVAGPETDATIAAGTATKGTYKPYSAGTFAYRPSTLVLGYSTLISGVSNSALAFPASDVGNRKAIHKREQVRSLHQSVWNWVTGQAGTTTVTVDYDGVSGTTDHAANPTRTVPGELVVLETGKTPTYFDYTAKTGG